METGIIFAAIVAALLLGAWWLGKRLERRRASKLVEKPATPEAPSAPALDVPVVKVATASPPVKSSRIPENALDLRQIPTVRTRVKGTAYYVRDSQRKNLGALHYYLVREPDNKHDTYAIKVLTPRGRHVGHVAAKRAASMSPLLDTIGAEAYIVAGAAATEHSVALWVDLPSIPELRKYVKANHG